MDFSLSSSLVGNAVSNPDNLALDLQFATDKTLTARKGPTPVFTRGSTATFVDSDGLVKAAPENLVLQSENFGTTWQTNNATITLNDVVAPDGSTTADRLNEDTTNSNHQVIQSIGSLIGGQPYTISVFAKAASHTTFQVATSTAAFGSGLFANFILTGSGSVGNSNGVTTSIGSYPNGWYRCSITINSVTGGTGGFVQIAAINNNSAFPRVPSYLGTNAQVVHLWGAQLERSSTVRTYNPTTTAVFYGPRFDHDPVTSVCKGLLMEESRTNSLAYSEDFANAYWSKSSTSTPSNTSIAPNGNSVNTSLQATGVTYPSVNKTISITTGSTITLSVFAKQLTTSVFSLELRGTGSAPDATFDLLNGTATGIGVITPFGNGWYRCSISKVINATSVIAIIGLGATAVVGNSILIWGAQMEAGSFPTSYIPTTTASVVRSADVCSITGSAFTGMWNPLEGTTLVSGDKTNSSNTTGSYFSYQSGATEVGPLMSRTQTAILGRIRNNAALDLTNLDVSQSPAGEKKLAVAWKATSDPTDRDYCSGGVVLAKSNPNTGTAANNQTTLTIGSRPSASVFNGTISSLRYYKKRLANAKLQAITV